jgi:hypothetical protein
MSKPLSVISHFYNNPAMVERQVAYWETLSDAFLERVEFVLIDDCSEQRPQLAPRRIDLKLFRITTDIPWNQAGARNLGSFVATGTHGLFMDIDQHFFEPPMLQLLDALPQLAPTLMLHLRIKELVNIQSGKSLLCAPSTFVVHLPTYRVRGRYDEDFAGHYGFEDLYAHAVWEANGGHRAVARDAVFLEDLGFATTTLDRDVERNRLLSTQKLAAGTRVAPRILRFAWEQVPLDA